MIVSLSISPEDQTLHMPYRGGPGSHSPAIGWIDLVAQPHRLDELPELEGFPELRELLVFLISPASHFAPLRIDSCLNVYQQPGFAHSKATFLTIVFRTPDPVQDVQYFRDLVYYFDQEAQKVDPLSTSAAKFFITPWTLGEVSGHCLDMYIQGYGLNDRLADRKWKGVHALVDRVLREANAQIVQPIT